MRKFSVIMTVLLSVCLMMTGCMEPFQHYDDDVKIAESNYYWGSCTFKPEEKDSSTIVQLSFFNGVYKIASIDLPENPTLTLTFTKTMGDCKLVLVGAGGDVTMVTDTNTAEFAEIPVTLSAGKYDLKLVGRSTTANLVYKFH